jgi:hypothetical protein
VEYLKGVFQTISMWTKLDKKSTKVCVRMEKGVCGGERVCVEGDEQENSAKN